MSEEATQNDQVNPAQEGEGENTTPEAGVTEPQKSEEPTPPAVDSVVEQPAEEPEENAQEGEGIHSSLNVNKFSSRMELETAGLALGLDEKKLASAGSQEALWKIVKNAYLAKKTFVSVDEDSGEGELMKVNVKHSGEFYKKGQRYVLSDDLREDFRSKFYI